MRARIIHAIAGTLLGAAAALAATPIAVTRGFNVVQNEPASVSGVSARAHSGTGGQHPAARAARRGEKRYRSRGGKPIQTLTAARLQKGAQLIAAFASKIN